MAKIPFVADSIAYGLGSNLFCKHFVWCLVDRNLGITWSSHQCFIFYFFMMLLINWHMLASGCG